MTKRKYPQGKEMPVALTEAPEGYVQWLTELKQRIHTAQQRATLAVNRERVQLYYSRSHAPAWECISELDNG